MGAAAQLDRIAGAVARPHREDATSSPYFSPNSASAPAATASSGVISRVADRLVLADVAVHLVLDRLDVLAGQRLGCEKSNRKSVRRDQAALLRDVAAEPLAQRGVQQMGGAVVGAHLAIGARRRP